MEGEAFDRDFVVDLSGMADSSLTGEGLADALKSASMQYSAFACWMIEHDYPGVAEPNRLALARDLGDIGAMLAAKAHNMLATYTVAKGNRVRWMELSANLIMGHVRLAVDEAGSKMG